MCLHRACLLFTLYAECWLHCNDANVTLSSFEEVAASQAYLLFYSELMPSSRYPTWFDGITRTITLPHTATSADKSANDAERRQQHPYPSPSNIQSPAYIAATGIGGGAAAASRDSPLSSPVKLADPLPVSVCLSPLSVVHSMTSESGGDSVRSDSGRIGSPPPHTPTSNYDVPSTATQNQTRQSARQRKRRMR